MAGRPKGYSKTGGRKKGSGNKDKEPIRNAIRLILEDNMHRLREEYKKLKGVQLIDRITQLLEYDVPKLNRTDLTNDGEKFDFNGTNGIESVERIMAILDTARKRGDIKSVSSN